MVQMTVRTIAITTAVTVSLSAALIARAAGPFKGHADLSPYQETPSTLSTPGRGTLDVEISKDGDSVAYTLSYQGLATNVLFAHIHLGRPATTGGVMVFLCTNGAAPAGVPLPPACPQGSGTVSGDLTVADVFSGAVGQGVAPGDFGEFVAALRAEAAYGNVHTSAFTGGEIRGQVTFSRSDSINDD